MAKTPKPKSGSSYKSVGRTYDGVKVLAPKTKSKTFTAAQVKQAIQKALEEVSQTGLKKTLRDKDAIRVQQRADGRFEVKKPGAKRASAVETTQKKAVARARELAPGKAPIAKRVRKTPGGKRGTWRET